MTARPAPETTFGLPAGVLGNVMFALCTAAISFYAFAVAGHATGNTSLDIFGLNWAEDGFCVSFKNTMFNSHLLCFYVDTFWSLLLLAVAVQGKSKNGKPENPGLREVRENIGSVFGHGLAHGYLWYISPLGETPLVEGMETSEALLAVSVTFVFFFLFVYYATPFPAWFSVFQCTVHTYLLLTSMKPLYIFTYVNTVLYFNIAGTKMLYFPRNRFYDMSALFASTPPVIVTWLEPILCDSFLIHYGGHLWFDSSIPIGVLLYYFVVKDTDPSSHQYTKKIQ